MVPPLLGQEKARLSGLEQEEVKNVMNKSVLTRFSSESLDFIVSFL